MAPIISQNTLNWGCICRLATPTELAISWAWKKHATEWCKEDNISVYRLDVLLAVVCKWAFKNARANPLEGFFFQHVLDMSAPSGDKIHYKNMNNVFGVFLHLPVTWKKSQWWVQCHWNSQQKCPCRLFARLHTNSSVPARADYSFDAVIEISQRVCLKQKLIVV